MSWMKAYQVVEWGRQPEFVDVRVPSPGPGEVRLRMKGAGLCRSDIDIMDSRAGSPPYASVLPAGFTLGHENAGVVDALGNGVSDLSEGDHVAVHHIHSCGHCEFCLDGLEPSCITYARGAVNMTRGVGIDGGLAEFMVVPRHELVQIGSLDPVKVAPLTDAGVTAYRAVATVAARLRPGTTAVVIGVGGLGAYGIQLVKLLTQARVYALDVSPRRLNLARELDADGAIHSGEQAAEQIMDLTNGRGADAILDFVGTDDTLALAARVSRPQGRIVLVGLEGGTLRVGWGLIATTCEFAISLGSTRADLHAICELAAAGKLRIDLEEFAFDRIGDAFGKLRKGDLNGRAVIAFD